MLGLVSRYTRWLHTRWPSGKVEKLPEVGPRGQTSVPGLRIVGDLTGIPLLKFSLHTGADAVRAFLDEGVQPTGPGNGPVDLAIIGAGVSGVAAAVEAKRLGFGYRLLEAREPFATIANFPKGKPIYTYPTDMVPAGRLAVRAATREDLLEELEAQRRREGVEVTTARVERVERRGELFDIVTAGGERIPARRVILAIGRSGDHRKLGIPGEGRDKVSNRLHDPADYAGRNVLVVGGGDSALEAAAALASAGANVTLSYRRSEFSRPKPENVDAVKRLQGPSLALALPSTVQSIGETTVNLRRDGRVEEIPNDAVFVMVGREAPLEFLRRSGVRISGQTSPRSWILLAAFTLAVLLVYLWKGWFLGHTGALAVGQSWGLDARTLAGTIVSATAAPGFWFTLVYTACIVGFGIARIRRRRTPYVTRQTLVLMAIQVVPLFLLPEILLPWMGANGWIPSAVESALFPNGEYWRSLGFILAWPLFLANIASPQPMVWWLIIGLLQTFVLIPLLVRRWGKGAYCGWICSCGALAETMGDTHRHKMWHGPVANRWNMAGQGILLLAAAVTAVFALSWHPALADALAPLARQLEKVYKLGIDVVIGGAIGVGLYFWFSGRVWCRFACPLAALMHVYARFSRFRIFADKKKCISCNVCTSVCHQGIDVMSFANKGLPMEDPQCVRCSACVQSCPTGVLQFGRHGSEGRIHLDALPASPVLLEERTPRSLEV